MNSVRIKYILSNDFYSRKYFQGFGNPDIPISEFKSYPAILILNTAPFLSDGEHWCVLCCEEEKCFFFDSFGKSPEEYQFLPILYPRFKNIYYNTKQVQCEKSKTCGHHCIYFVKEYSTGKDPESIMKSYSSFCRKNDNMVFDYVTRQYGDIIGRIRM